MQIKDYLLVKSLGKGTFGEVFLTKKGKSSKLYATKKIPSSKLLNKDFKKYLENEINIMKQLEHENIIKYHESYQTSNNIYIIMDYINGGNLSEYLTKYKLKNSHPFSQAMIQYFVKQIVEGLIYIHRKNIIHRDIKLENILLQIPNHTNADLVDYSLTKVKIIDFGLSTQSNLATSLVGSPIYMDPNILKKYEKSGGTEKFKSYDKKADIWSLGAITYEMLTGHNVFNASSLPELLNKVKKGDYTLEVNCLSNEILSFLNGMLQNDPEKRATAKQLLEHPFLTKNPSDFHKIDTSKIDYKIDKYGFLTINIINNETIGKEFPFFKPLSINLELISDKFSEKNRTEIKKDDPKQDIRGNNKIINQEHEKIQERDKTIPETEKKENNQEENTEEPSIKLPKIKRTETIILENDQLSNHYGSSDNNDLLRANSLNIKLTNDSQELLTPGISIPYKPMKSEEIINKSKNKEYKVKFQVERMDNKNESVNMNISFLVNQNNTLKKEVQLNDKNKFKFDWVWAFNSNDWKNIDNNNENFLMRVEFDKSKHSKLYRVEIIKLGKPIFFISYKVFKFTLTPIMNDF